MDTLGNKSSWGAQYSPGTKSPSLEGFTAGLDRAMACLVQLWPWSYFDRIQMTGYNDSTNHEVLYFENQVGSQNGLGSKQIPGH